ncbi:transposase [Candidatus Omnitrophota bacterium]
MLRKQSIQKDFFDSYVYERLLPKKHILLDIREKIDFSFIDQEVRSYYSDDARGRPPFEAGIIFKILFLEFYYNLSDYEAIEQVRSNILFRYFVGLGISQPTPDDTTLVKFRARLGEEGFKRLFDKIIEQAKQNNLIKGNLKILDATHITSDAALSGVVNLLRHGRSIATKKISKTHLKDSENLRKTYVNEDRLSAPPAKEQITRELDITKSFIAQTKGKFNPEADEFIELLETACSKQQRKVLDPNHREPDEIVSFTDKDSRFGYKSEKKKFSGYKAHASLDDESGIVTSARTIAGNRNEARHGEVDDIIADDKSKGIIHKALVADSLYDSSKNRLNIHKHKMKAFIPSRTKTGNVKIKLDNFTYDKDKDTLLCPEGRSPISATKQEDGTLYIFSTTQYRYCRNLYNCAKPNQDRIRIFVSDSYKLKLMDNIPYKKEAFIKRKYIERKFGEVKK